MISIIMIILGILVISGAVAGTVFAFTKTPDNLSGFYGLFYFILAGVAIFGGLALIGLGLIS